MKKSIIHLGVLVTLFINSAFTSKVVVAQQNNQENISLNVTLPIDNNEIINKIVKPKVNEETIEEINKTVVFISSNYKKSIEETIQEGKEITESEEFVYQPLYINFTFEEMMELNDQIIESTICNETQPLDFDIINGNENKKQLVKADKISL
jgi:hypothetical protein